MLAFNGKFAISTEYLNCRGAEDHPEPQQPSRLRPFGMEYNPPHPPTNQPTLFERKPSHMAPFLPSHQMSGFRQYGTNNQPTTQRPPPTRSCVSDFGAALYAKRASLLELRKKKETGVRTTRRKAGNTRVEGCQILDTLGMRGKKVYNALVLF